MHEPPGGPGRRSAPRRPRPVLALWLVVVAATLGVSTSTVAAHAAARADDEPGESWVWAADGPGNFSDPANWQRGSDLQPGVPGPGDDAFVSAGDVTIDQPVDLASLVFAGSSLTIGARFSADTITLSGSVVVDAPVSAKVLRLQDVDAALAAPVTLVEPGDDGTPRQLALQSARVTGGDELSSEGPVAVSIEAGTDLAPSSIRPYLHLTDPTFVVGRATGPLGEVSAVLTGTVYADGDVTLVGDIPRTMGLRLGVRPTVPPGAGTLTWSGASARLDGGLSVPDGVLVSLPDELDIGGLLELGPEAFARGGTTRVAAGAAIGLYLFGGGTDVPQLELTGPLDLASGARLLDRSRDVPCVGTEDVAVRAAGGIVAADDLTIATALPAWVTPEAVLLRRDLVAVARRATAGGGEVCTGPSATRRVDQALYRDLLGRPGDNGGLTHWDARVDGGSSVASVASALLTTPEGRAAAVRAAYAAYACLPTDPDPTTTSVLAAFLAGGGELDRLRAQVLATTATSLATPADVVGCLYRTILGRDADAAGQAYVEALLADHDLTDVALRLLRSPEARRTQVDRLFRHLLGRPADAGALDYWADQLRAGRSEASLTIRIAGATEFAARNSA